MSSVIMFPENRFYAHITVMSTSLFVVVAFTVYGKCKDNTLTGAYTDSDTNMVAVVFCIVEIFGAVSAWESSGAFEKKGGTPIPEIQVAFIISLLFVLLLIVVLAVKATYERIQIARQATKISIKSMWTAYTKCEVIFLLPILLIVSFALLLGRWMGRVYRCRCRCWCRCCGSRTATIKVHSSRDIEVISREEKNSVDESDQSSTQKKWRSSNRDRTRDYNAWFTKNEMEKLQKHGLKEQRNWGTKWEHRKTNTIIVPLC